jgi:hypothetical protein
MLRLGGLKFQISPGNKVHETPSQKKKLGMVVHSYHSSLSEKHKIRGSLSRLSPAKGKTLSQKYLMQKKVGGTVQEERACLGSINPSTAKN